MSSKKKTETHQVTAPTNPDWVTNSVQGLTGRINDLSNVDPKSFVAAPNSLLNQAGSGASSLTSGAGYGQANDIFNNVAGSSASQYAPNSYNATGYDAAQGSASSLLDHLSDYYNPFKDQITNPVMADFDFNAGQTRANQALDEARSGAFGGSGAAITRSATEDSLSRGRASTLGGLLNQMFNTSTALAGQDADRSQNMSLANMGALNNQRQFNAGAQNDAGQFNTGAQNTALQYNAGARDTMLARQLAAAQGLSGNATAQGADARENAGTQADIGSVLQQIDQMNASSPLDLLQAQTGMLGSLPYQLFNGQTMDGTQTSTTSGLGNALGALGSLGMGLGAMGAFKFANPIKLSDERLKRDIVKVGERPDGLGIYLYRYLWSPIVHLGVMAQEVLKVKPQAVVTTPSGFYAVDYGML